MKMILKFAAVLSAVVLMASCGSNDNALVKETTDNFLNAMVAGDLAKAKEFVTPATAEVLTAVAKLDSVVISDDVRKAITEKMAVAVDSVVVAGEEATATCVIAIPYVFGDVKTLHLSKVEGKWLINEPALIIMEYVAPVVVDTTVVATEPVAVEATPAAKK